MARQKARQEIEEAIRAGAQPRVPGSGLGLELPGAGRRRKVLVNAQGQVTPAGRYFYDSVGETPPATFDYSQNPVRRGRSLYVTLLDGSRRAVSRFDAVSKQFKPTKLGTRFYDNKTVKYTVLFPVRVDLTRKNGSIFTREGDWMPSTAVSLGELEVKASLSDEAQRAEVTRRAEDWMRQQEEVEGELVLLAGYETHRLDRARPLQYNKLEFSEAGEPSATMHRPLTAGQPWAFPFGGQSVVSEALQDSNDECVVRQLSKYIRLKGEDRGCFSKEQLARELRNASLEEYEGCEENEDLLQCPGFTGAAIRRVCHAHGIPFHVHWGAQKLESYVPEETRYQAVAILIWGDHLYTLDAGRKKKVDDAQLDERSWVLAPVQRTERRTPGLTHWELFTRLSPGHFYSRELDRVRAALHAEHICPDVVRDGMGRLKALTYNDCHVHGLPREADVCQEYLAQLARIRPHGVTYRGETFAGFMQQVFDSLCVVQRRAPPTYLERRAVSARCGGLCEGCGDPLGSGGHVDHSVPRHAFGRDCLGNLQVLCSDCHAIKTHSVDRDRVNVEDINPFTSRFNAHLWEAFVQSRRPHQVVARLHEASDGPLWHVDVRSCRLHALTECNQHPIPIFSPLDEVTEQQGTRLADYHWVCVPRARRRSPLKSFAYDGPRWYSRAELQFLLETGTAEWQDVRLALNATAHRPAQELATRLFVMREVWDITAGTSVGQEFLGARAAKTGLLGKTALLSLLGAWGRTRHARWKTVTTNHPDDCPFTGEVMRSPAPGSTVFHDITWRQEVRSYASLLPLSLVARSLERLNVARGILVCLKHVRPERILSIQVDALCIQPPRKRARQLTEELESLTYENVHEATRRPLERYVGLHLQDAIPSKEKIFQLKQLDEPLDVGGELTVSEECDAPEPSVNAWAAEVLEPTRGSDNFHERIVAHVLGGSSCCVTGGPGTGKSHLIRAVRDALLEAGQQVQVLAPSNAAARVVQGSTVHAFLTRMASSQYGFQGVLLLDEVSMLSVALVAVLDQLRAGGECRIIATGDWEQLPPVGNSWRGQPVDARILRDSALLKRWSDGAHFVLTRCRRSDAAHFRFYQTLPRSSVTASVLRARARYPASEDGTLHLCVSHRKRRAINARMQAAVEGITIPAFGEEPEYQAAPGTPLVGRCTGRGFVNGAFYVLAEAVEGGVKVTDTLTEAVLEATPEQLAKHTCLAHAVVYNRAQGLTVDGHTVVLHDLHSRWFSRAHLYVGLSRVTNGADIRIAPAS